MANGVYTVTVPGVPTPVSVHIEDFEGTEGSLSYEGWEYHRSYKVEGLEGSGIALLPRALQALSLVPINPGLYIGSYAPGLADMRLDRISGRPLAVGIVAGTIHYTERGGGTFGNNIIRVDSSVVEYATDHDINGNKLYAIGPNGVQQPTIGKKFLPNMTAEIELMAYDDPVAIGKLYVGAVNAGPCPWDRSAQPRCWMCVSVPSDSRDRGISWHRKYVFQYQPPKSTSPYIAGWDNELVVLDPTTGLPAKGSQPTGAIQQTSEDFNTLNVIIF